VAGVDVSILITCPRCGTRYSVAKNKIPPRVRSFRCKACSTSFPWEGKEEPGREPRRLAISLSKAGVGKTTTAVNLAAGLALAGFSVLLVDADPAGRAAASLGVARPEGGLFGLVAGELSPEQVLVEARERLWLLPGGHSLSGLRRIIAGQGRAGEATLAQTLAGVEGRFDYVLVDTSPDWDALTIGILAYVRELIIPVSLEVMSVQGFGEFLQLLEARGRYGKELRLKYIVPTFYDPRIRKSVDIYEKFRNVYGELVCAPIACDGELAENQGLGKTVFDLDRESRGRQDYEALVRKVAGLPPLPPSGEAG